MTLMRHFVAILVLLGVATIGAPLSFATDDYPSRPVRIIVPFGAG
jgi:tripartite-type tricarboxylate transporter receptor subunit TctC